MKQVNQDSTQKGRVDTIIRWPKCSLCGKCHPNTPSKCPRIQGFFGPTDKAGQKKST